MVLFSPNVINLNVRPSLPKLMFGEIINLPNIKQLRASGSGACGVSGSPIHPFRAGRVM
jgi:hypothetical protein